MAAKVFRDDGARVSDLPRYMGIGYLHYILLVAVQTLKHTLLRQKPLQYLFRSFSATELTCFLDR